MTGATPPETFVVHDGLTVSAVDRSFCDLVGVAGPDALVGTSLSDLVSPADRTALAEHVARIENGDAPVLGLALELEAPGPERARVILVSSAIEWAGREQVHTTVIPVLEPDSPAGRLLSDAALDEAPIGITIADPSQSDNPLVYVNDGFTDLTGYPREEILGRNCRFLQGADTRQEPVSRIRAAIDAAEPVTVDLRNYRKDGSMFWNRVTIVPIRSESGALTHFLGYQQDVTAEKRFEQDLTLFREQAEGSEKAIMITDPEGTLEYVNPAFERLTGYSAQEAIGQNPRILKSDEQNQAFYAELWEQITAGEVWEGELVNRTKSGELYRVRQKIIPVSEEGTITHFVAIEQDITENVLKTQSLAVLNRVLRHNLRNAVNVIYGHADLLEAADQTPAARQASIATIRDQADAIQRIVEKTADVRAIWDPAGRPQSWRSLEFPALVASYRETYPEATITAAVDDADAVVVQNAKLFEQAIEEAVTNAVEHVEDGPPEVSITATVDPETTTLAVTVADNGPGVPETERHVIDAGEETPLRHSLGVGLWIMEWIMTALGGSLTIEDGASGGTEVTFRVPAREADGSAQASGDA